MVIVPLLTYSADSQTLAQGVFEQPTVTDYETNWNRWFMEETWKDEPMRSQTPLLGSAQPDQQTCLQILNARPPEEQREQERIMLKFQLTPVEPVRACVFNLGGRRQCTYNGFNPEGIWLSAQARAMNALQEIYESGQGVKVPALALRDRPETQRRGLRVTENACLRQEQGCILRSRAEVEKEASRAHTPARCAAPKTHDHEIMAPLYMEQQGWCDWRQHTPGWHKRTDGWETDWREWTQKDPKQRRYASDWQERPDSWEPTSTGSSHDCWSSHWSEWSAGKSNRWSFRPEEEGAASWWQQENWNDKEW